MATGPFEVGAFIRTEPVLPKPNAPLYLGAFTMVRGSSRWSTVERKPGLTISGQLLQATSEGTLRITSADSDALL